MAEIKKVEKKPQGANAENLPAFISISLEGMISEIPEIRNCLSSPERLSVFLLSDVFCIIDKKWKNKKYEILQFIPACEEQRFPHDLFIFKLKK